MCHPCPMRKLLLDFCVFENHKIARDEYPREFEQVIIDRLYEVTSEDRWARSETKTNLPDRLRNWSVAQQAQQNKCEYHAHHESRDECKQGLSAGLSSWRTRIYASQQVTRPSRRYNPAPPVGMRKSGRLAPFLCEIYGRAMVRYRRPVRALSMRCYETHLRMRCWR